METRMRITAGCSSQLDLAFVLSKTKLALCGKLEVMVRLVFFQLRTLPDIIQYFVYHCTLLQLLSTVLPLFFRNFKPSDIETTWF